MIAVNVVAQWHNGVFCQNLIQWEILQLLNIADYFFMLFYKYMHNGAFWKKLFRRFYYNVDDCPPVIVQNGIL